MSTEEPLQEGQDSSVQVPVVSRVQAASSLASVRRLALFGGKDADSVNIVRYADRVCLSAIHRALQSDLSADEREAVSGLRDVMVRCTDSAPVSDRIGLLRKTRKIIDRLDALMSLDRDREYAPLASLLPPDEVDRIKKKEPLKIETEAAPVAAPPPAPNRRPEPARELHVPRRQEERPTRRENPREGVFHSGGLQHEQPKAQQPQDDNPPVLASFGDESLVPKPHVPSSYVPGALVDDGEVFPRPADSQEAIMDERVRKWEEHAVRNRSDGAPSAPVMREEEPEPEEESRNCCYLRDSSGAGQLLRPGGLLSPIAWEALKEAGILTYADILLQPPKRHEVLPKAVDPSDAMEESSLQVVRGVVSRRLTRLGAMGRRFEVHLSDGAASVVCRWISPVDEIFRQRFHAGSKMAVYGRIEIDGEMRLLVDGELVWIDSRGQGRQAIYEIPGIPDEEVRTILRWAVDEFSTNLLDPLPEEMIRNLRLLGLGEAIRRLHFPTHGYRRGRDRLAFEELLLYQLGMGIRRRRTAQERGSAHVLSHKLVAQAQQIHNIVMNDEQETAFSEIRRDLVRNRPMNRLLQGDVGAGKGTVALLTAIMVAENREQVVFLAPDAMAAEHRFLFAEPILKSVGLATILVTDPNQASQIEAIRAAESMVVFSTHAMTRSWPTFKRLGLVIVEERESYGIASLADLPAKNGRPDLLVLSNAPLPTSIALTVFGDMELSLVNAPGLSGTQTEVFKSDQRREAYAKVIDELEAGRQLYVVLPLLNGLEPLDMKDLARFADVLRTDAFPGYRIGLFTGLMSREERQRVYDDFRHRRINVLITTSVIEDGPVVPAATIMIVEQADRYDLIRLHRLRAHVSRGIRPGRFYMVLSNTPDPLGEERVELISRERDGFRVAEHHLAQRGASELLGDRAKEMPVFRYVEPLEHRDLLVRARSEAFSLLALEPLLGRQDLGGLRNALEESWQRWFPGQPVLSARKPAGKNLRWGGRKKRKK